MRLEAEKGLNEFFRQQEEELKKRKNLALQEEIARQKLIYNAVLKYVPIYGVKYRDSIEDRARINIEARFT